MELVSFAREAALCVTLMESALRIALISVGIVLQSQATASTALLDTNLSAMTQGTNVFQIKTSHALMVSTIAKSQLLVWTALPNAETAQLLLTATNAPLATISYNNKLVDLPTAPWTVLNLDQAITKITQREVVGNALKTAWTARTHPIAKPVINRQPLIL